MIVHDFGGKRSLSLFSLAITPVIAFAMYGTIGEVFGFAECPRTDSGIPMCFLSLGISGTLAILKIMESRSTPKE